MDQLKQRYDTVKGLIKDHCKSHGRHTNDIRLIAVSKRHPSASIRGLYNLGQRVFGENYASELFEKAHELSDLEIEWIYIGALQSNKIARLVEVCSEIHTVSSEKHLRYIDKYAAQQGKNPFPVYLQVNLGGEHQKAGFSASELKALHPKLPSFSNVLVRGLMAIPPKEDSVSQALAPPSYKLLSELNQSLDFHHLSVGMSADLEKALACGSTDLRVGSAIFGPRPT